MADDQPAIAERVFEPAAARIQRGAPSSYPYLFSLTGEDQLELSSWDSLPLATLALQGRVHRTDGLVVPLSARHRCVSDRRENATYHEVPPGDLLNAMVFASEQAPILGQTFARLSVIRGNRNALTRLAVLCQGPVTDKLALGFPGSPIRYPTDSRPLVRVINGTLPNPGAEISETVPAVTIWSLRSVVCVLITNATAGTRQPGLEITSGGFTMARITNPGSIGPSTTGVFVWIAGVTAFNPVVGSNYLATLPPDMVLPANTTFSTSTAGLTAGDQWLAPSYDADEWLECR
jgi:hypothetical protein